MPVPSAIRFGGRAYAALVMALALAGCQEALHSKLTEADANEMLGALLDANVDAEKLSPDGKTWTVSVAKDDLGRSLAVLRANGLPAQHRTNLGEVFKKDGLISTPTEERVRFIHGISEELAGTISSIDGVMNARVHVVLPNNDPLAEQVKLSSASVFIKHRADISVATLIPVVKSLVMRSVEGLTYDNVNVTLVASHPVSIANAHRLPALRGAWVGIWTVLLLALLILAAACSIFAMPKMRPRWVPPHIFDFAARMKHGLQMKLKRFKRQDEANAAR